MNLRVSFASRLWMVEGNLFGMTKRKTLSSQSSSVGQCSAKQVSKRLKSYAGGATSSTGLMPSVLAALGGWPYWTLRDLQTFFQSKNGVRRWRWAMAAGKHAPLPSESEGL